MKTKMMKKVVPFVLLLICSTTQAQIQTLWETKHPVGNDSLEIMFHKQDSVGNHYMGGGLGSNYFLSKFDATGVHQWTRNANEYIQHPLFPTMMDKTIYFSWVSDIAFRGSEIYVSGIKCYSGQSCYNFLLKLNENGDSVGFINVVKEDTAASFIYPGLPHLKKVQISILNNEIYFFTSIWATPTEFGQFNINVFKYDESMNLLKYKAFDGALQFSRDDIINIRLIGNNFLIQSFEAETRPRLLYIDTSLSLKWQYVHKVLATPKHSTLSPKIHNSTIYTFANVRDTSKKDSQSGLGYKLASQLRKYDLFGNFLDSLIIQKSQSSNDSLTDATIDNSGNVYTASISKDSGNYKILISKISPDFQIEKQILIAATMQDKVKITFSGCRLYISFIDSLNDKRTIGIMRLDEYLKVLSVQNYYAGIDRIYSITAQNSQIHLLSIGKSNLADTLSMKNLIDTFHIAEPTVFTTIAKSPESIEIKWQLSSGLNDTVFIYKSLNDTNWQLFKTLPSSELSFIDSNLTPSTKYYYSIRSIWENEYSCTELFASDSTPLNTNVNKLNKSTFYLYPNPANEIIYINGTKDIEELELLTLTGITIKHLDAKDALYVNELPSGIYFIRINKTYTYKILKL